MTAWIDLHGVSLPRCRQPGVHGRALTWRGLHLPLAAQGLYALAHAGQAMAAVAQGGGLKADAIVVHRDHDLRPLGLGVSIVNPGFVETPLTAGNDFRMPALLEPEAAAAAVLQGWERGRFHIHFPRRFTSVLLGLRLLPYRAYFAAVRRFTGL